MDEQHNGARHAFPSLEHLREQLLPTRETDRWDDGELPQAILNLEDHAMLMRCSRLLDLCCVGKRSVDRTNEARVIALREVLAELLPEDLDHPCCGALRALAGLQPGAAGQCREARQRIAGACMGSTRFPASPRTVRRRVKQHCWPWLLDRLLSREADERRDAPTAATSQPESQASAPPAPALQEADASLVLLPVVMHSRLEWMPMRVPRRTFLKGTGAALLAPIAELITPDERERIDAVIEEPRRVDTRSIEHFETVLAEYRRLDDLMGSRHVHGPVQAASETLQELCQTTRSEVRPALLSVAAQYEQLNAWLWIDRGDPTRAQRCHDAALARATEAGDQALAGYVLGCKAKQALEERAPTTAIALAQEARSGRWHLTPTVSACTAELEARGWALRGDPDECDRRLDDAETLLAKRAERSSAAEPPWIYYFGPERLPAHRGVSYARLGRVDAAIEIFDEAIAQLPDSIVRDRAWYLLWSAKAHASNGDIAQAAIVARHAAEIALDTGSSSVLEELRALQQRLAADKTHPAVRELTEITHGTPAETPR